MTQRLQSAAGRHQAHIDQVRRKAETENQKVHEVGFILQVQNEAKRIEISRKLEDSDRRREAALEEVRAKATSVTWRRPRVEAGDDASARTPPRMTIGSFLAARNSATRSVGARSADSVASSIRRRTSSGGVLHLFPGDGTDDIDAPGSKTTGETGGFAPSHSSIGGLLSAGPSDSSAGGLLGTLARDGSGGGLVDGAGSGDPQHVHRMVQSPGLPPMDDRADMSDRVGSKDKHRGSVAKPLLGDGVSRGEGTSVGALGSVGIHKDEKVYSRKGVLQPDHPALMGGGAFLSDGLGTDQGALVSPPLSNLSGGEDSNWILPRVQRR